MRKIYIPMFSIFTLMTYCSFFGLFSGDKISEKRQIIGKINQRLSTKFRKVYGLNFMGISEAAVDGKYKCIGFELNSKRILSKDEGRILLIRCAENILTAINSYPGFEKYLINYPFTVENIIVNIFVQPSNVDAFEPDIGLFSSNNDTFRYSFYSRSNGRKSLSEKETYDEAKQIVEAQMNSQQYHDGY